MQEKSSCSRLRLPPSLVIVKWWLSNPLGVKSCPSVCSTGMWSICICCKYFEPEQFFALEKVLSSFHIDTCAQALFQYKYWLHKKQILVKIVKCLAEFVPVLVEQVHTREHELCQTVDKILPVFIFLQPLFLLKKCLCTRVYME